MGVHKFKPHMKYSNADPFLFFCFLILLFLFFVFVFCVLVGVGSFLKLEQIYQIILALSDDEVFSCG